MKADLNYYLKNGWTKKEDRDEFGRIIEFSKSNENLKICITIEAGLNYGSDWINNRKFELVFEKNGLRFGQTIKPQSNDLKEIRVLCQILNLK